MSSVCLAVVYSIIHSVSPLLQCQDQWSYNSYSSKPCKIVQKTGLAVNLYCDVDSSTFTTISWYYKLRGTWVPIVKEDSLNWEPTVYLSLDKKNLTLLKTYIDYYLEDGGNYFSDYSNPNGTYKCKASGKSVSVTRTMELELYECSKGENVRVHTTKTVLTDLGRTVNSSCVADYGCEHSEPFTADWYLRLGNNYTKVSDLEGTRYHVESVISNAGRYITTKLRIRDIQKGDFGDNFVCIVADTRYPLHIRRVDLVKRELPFPVIFIAVPLLFLVIVVIAVFIMRCYHRTIRLYVNSHYFHDPTKVYNNKLLIHFDDEEMINKDGICEDRELALEIANEFIEQYEVSTSLDFDLCQPGQAECHSPFKGFSTHFVILPDFSNGKRFREIDSRVSCSYKNDDISLRYLTIIDRNEKVPAALKNAFLLSKLLVHVKRPEKEATEKQKDLFYKTLKNRTSPRPDEKETDNKPICVTCGWCCCNREKNLQVNVGDGAKLIEMERGEI